MYERGEEVLVNTQADGKARSATKRRRVEAAPAERSAQQAVVAGLGHLALAGADLPQLFDRAVAQVAETLGVEYCKVLELLPDGALKLVAGVGWQAGLVGHATVGGGRDSQAGFTLLSRAPVVVDDLRVETRFSGPQLLHDHGVVSGISVIIGEMACPFGVLGAHTARRRGFTPDDVNFFESVAHVLAEAVHRQHSAEVRHLHSAALNAAADAIVITDRQGAIEWVNAAYSDLTGFSFDEAQGKWPLKLVKSGMHDRAFYTELLDVVAAGDVWRGEITSRRKDGSLYPEQLTITPVKDALGGITHFVTIGRDLTEQRRLEAKAMSAQVAEKSQVILRTAMDGFWIVDMQGRILEANEAYCNLIGYTRAELLAMAISDIEAVESQEAVAAHIAAVKRTGSERFMAHHRRKDGVVLDVEVSANYLPRDGRVFVFVRDVTERQRLHAALVEANETLEHRVVARTAELETTIAALRESEASFRSLFDTAADAILVLNADVCLDCNASAEAMFGCRREDLVGQSPVEFSPPKQPDGQLSSRKGSAYIDAALKGAPQSFEWKHRRADGTVFDAEVRLNRVELGGVTHLQAIVRDVSHRKRAELDRRRSRIEYKALFESANDPIIIFEPEEEIILEANERACSTYGFSRDDLVGTSLKVLTKDVESGERALRELLRTGTVNDLETTHLRKDGTQIDVLVSASVIEFKGRRAVQTITRDITRRRLADEALRLHSAALNAAASAIVITALDGTIEWVNVAFSALSGYSAEEAVGRNPRDLVKSGVHEPAFYKHMWDTLLAGDVWSGEMTNRRKDGGVYAEEMTITPVRGADGQVKHFIAIKRDLTEQRELAAQFLQAQKMEIVGRLTGVVAHDFNNLLTIINATAELAANGLKLDDPLRVDLQEISRAGERAEGLTRQLLAFSRKQVMQPRILDLSTQVVELQRMLQRLVGEDVALVIVPAEGVGAVMADPGQIEQVILNLVVNARDAMPGGGTLTIETRDATFDEVHAAQHLSLEPGSYAMLAVSDTGVGMDAATHARIFEPFFTTKDPGKGTGLGLSTVFRIVEESGGGVWVYSEVGKGTTFKVYLPRVEDTPGAQQIAAAAMSARGTETLIVVEDDTALRHLTQRVLESAGFTVLVAASGTDALQLLERHDGLVDLMLTDVVMPGMKGPELAARAVDVRPLMKVLYTSGYTDHAIVRHGILDTGRFFISKPYATGELTRKVREILDS
jgi:PAS domain S-box-containing protein